MNNNPEDGSPIRLPGKAVLPNRNYHLRRKQQRLDEKAEFESRIAEGEEQHRRVHNAPKDRDDADRKATEGSVLFPNPVVRSWDGQGPETSEIEDVKEHVFRSLRSNVISLQWKGLEEFPSDLNTTLLTQFNKIRQVFLCGNRLQQLPSWNKRHFRALTTLNVSHNRLTSLPDSLTTIDSLRLLILDKNFIEALPQDFGALCMLEELRINDNALRTFPVSFGKLRNLKRLDANRNQLCEIPMCLARLAKLESLSLNQNAITTLAFMPPPEKPHKSWDKADVRLEEGNEETRREQSDAMHQKLAFGKHVMERRRQLAEAGVSIWTRRVDFDTGRSYFVNNVMSSEQSEIPKDLDKLGNLSAIKRLSLKSNAIPSIPASIAHLSQLTELLLDGNKICNLPAAISQCRRLQHFSISDNSLTEVPDELAELEELEKLNMAKNNIEKVTQRLAALPNLRKLWLGENELTHLPSNLCHLPQIDIIDLFGNPLEPPFDKLLSCRDVQSLCFHLRQEYLRETQGRPPKISPVHYGIAHEKRDTNIHFDAEMQRLLQQSARTHTLSLPWKSLTALPRGFWRVRQLCELHLVGNAFTSIPEEILAVEQLRVLNMRSNKLTHVPAGVGGLGRLEELLLEDNRIEFIHEDVGLLSKLHTLRLSGNLLERLPQSFGGCIGLKVLAADVNRLELLPDVFSNLSLLCTVKLSKNRISALPGSLFACPLESLELDLNVLNSVPSELYAEGSNLVHLRMSHNALNSLPEDFGEGGLRNSLQSLWIYANSIKELPLSMRHLSELKDIRIGNNGMRSPPEALAVAGAQSVVSYCAQRHRRLTSVQESLTANGFEYDPNHLRPVTESLITGLAGRLSKADLAKFSTDIDAFVNGALTGEESDGKGKEMVETLAELREARLASFRRMVLLRLVVVMELLQAKRGVCRRVYFNPHLRWQWSRFKTLSDCYAVSLEALFTDQKSPNQEAVCKILRRAQSNSKRTVDLDGILFHGELIPLNVECLKDALDNFVDPLHGQVSTSSALVTMKRDQKRNVAVLNKVIYTEEEAEREKQERHAVQQHIKHSRSALEEWLRSVDAEVKMKLEINRRKDALKAQAGQQKQRLKAAEIALKKAKQQRPRHRSFVLNAMSKSTVKLDKMVASDKVREAENELRLAYEERKEAQRRLKDKSDRWQEECKTELRKRVERMAKRDMIRAGRQLAYKKNLRRPWDGKNGIKYRRWRNMKDAMALDLRVELGEEDREEGTERDAKEEASDKTQMPVIYHGWSELEEEDTDEELAKVFADSERQSTESEDDSSSDSESGGSTGSSSESSSSDEEDA